MKCKNTKLFSNYCFFSDFLAKYYFERLCSQLSEGVKWNFRLEREGRKEGRKEENEGMKE
jgi:hypothetical protein